MANTDDSQAVIDVEGKSRRRRRKEREEREGKERRSESSQLQLLCSLQRKSTN